MKSWTGYKDNLISYKLLSPLNAITKSDRSFEIIYVWSTILHGFDRHMTDNLTISF